MSFYTDEYQILSFDVVDRTDREEMRRRVDGKAVQFVAMALANAMVSRGELPAISGGINFMEERYKKEDYDRIMDNALVAVYAMTLIKE